jgi:hypothetical protein
MQHLWTILPAVLLGAAVLYAAWIWRRRVRDAPYDLRRLRDAHYEGWLAPGEEPDDGLVTEDSGPYCVSCDEAYPAGTTACRHCRRPL